MKLIDAIKKSDSIIFDSYNRPFEVTTNNAFIENVLREKIGSHFNSIQNKRSSTPENLVWTINDKIFASFANNKEYKIPARKMIIKYYVYKEHYNIH
jgi:hypothetical protein